MAKKTPRERQVNQFQSLPIGGPQLDLEAPEGRYEVDRAIKGRLWNLSESSGENIRRARRIANQGVAYGYSVAEAALVRYPGPKGAVDGAYEALHKISALAEAVAAAEPFDVMCGGARFRPTEFFQKRFGAESAFREAQMIIELAAKLSTAFLERYPPPSRPNIANVQWLARSTMLSWAEIWMQEIGFRAGRGENGPFIKFAAAVWTDLDLPAIDQNNKNQSDDIIGWLGQLWGSQKRPLSEVSGSKSP
jgi:hypothetical protein